MYLTLKSLGASLGIVSLSVIAGVTAYADQETNQPLAAAWPEASNTTRLDPIVNAPLQSIINKLELNLAKTNLDADTRQQLEVALKNYQGLANSQTQVQSNLTLAIARGVPRPIVIVSERVPASPWITSSRTNIPDMNFMNVTERVSNSPVSHDAMEDWLSKMIDSTRRDLEKPDLAANMHQQLQWKLKQLEGQLADHRTLVRSNEIFVEAIRSNPRSALTNMPDPISQTWASIIKRNERELADPALNPYRRQALETIVANAKQQLSDHQTNAQLWANLVQDQISGNSQQAARDQAKLADYLAAQLGKAQGKTYTQGMSLEAVMAEYQKQAKGSHWFNSRTVIRAIILTIFLLPPLVMIYMAIKKRASK
jgi:hypothetical protein